MAKRDEVKWQANVADVMAIQPENRSPYQKKIVADAMAEPEVPEAKKRHSRSERDAHSFVDELVERYGVASALERAHSMTHERKPVPQWLARAIEILTELKGA